MDSFRPRSGRQKNPGQVHMQTPSEANRSAILWHSRIARHFGASYGRDRAFLERFALWEEVIARHSDARYRALDIGCGTGEFLPLLAGRNAEVVGLDGSEEMLKISAERLGRTIHRNVHLVQSDIAGIATLNLGRFDLIIASSVLEYIADLESTLRDIAALLNPAGCFVFSIPNRSSIFRRLQPVLYGFFRRPPYFPYIRHLATEREISALLAAQNFVVQEVRYFSPTVGLSGLLRPLGLRAWSENLILLACTLQSPSAPHQS
jgi:2-polyprenyl-6-hydroxyphenyl methylase/3-demethylubiquinone-9 3-methyltransferase